MSTGATQERRAFERLNMRLPLHAAAGSGVVAGRSEDISVGGAKIVFDEDHDLSVGQEVDISVALPGRREPLRTRAEVRWRGRGRSVGVSFGKPAQAALAAFFAGLCGLASSNASANATVPNFDPNATVHLTEDGSERPDEHVLKRAFKRQNRALDQCVAQAKEGADTVLQGNAQMEVLLNPEGARPLGVNAKVPSPLGSDQNFRECLRAATAAAPFPAYDGPPVVVEFDFQIDAGYDVEEDW